MSWQPLNFSDKEVDEFVKDFKKKARFYLDEPVSSAVGEMLEAQGYKVLTARILSMTGRSDEDHAALCWREGMILVTTDRDFLDPKKLPDHCNPGVVVLDVGDGGDAAYRAAYFVGILVGPFGREWRQMRVLVHASGEVTIWNRNASTGAIEGTRYRFTRNGPSQIWVED